MTSPVSSWSAGTQAASAPTPPNPAAPLQPQPRPSDPGGFVPRPAGFWIRFVAQFVDGLVLAAAQFVLFALVGVAAALLGGMEDGPGPAFFVLFGLVYLALIVGTWLYWALQESSAAQATLGKRAFGLVVADEAGRRIGFGRATGRLFAKILSAIPLELGFVVAAFTDRKRALHDYVAGTVVERRRPAGTGGIVAAVAGGGFLLIFLVGVLAAIAIPNYVKFQLRAKEVEARGQLEALASAQAALAAGGQPFAELSLPTVGTPGRAKLAWSAEDREAAAALGWAVEGGTYFSYRVAVEEDDEGRQAWSACAESDLDGDGTFAAWAMFQPATDDAGEVLVEPPEAPCTFGPELERPSTWGPDDPAGSVLKLSPREVY